MNKYLITISLCLFSLSKLNAQGNRVQYDTINENIEFHTVEKNQDTVSSIRDF